MASALDLNLRHLRALRAVADAGSIARAAERLHRVPSAVARAVAELEAALARPLFERRPRGMVPTPAGAIVLARARRIEDELDEARQLLPTRAGARAAVGGPTPFASLLNGRRLAVIAALADTRSTAASARAHALTQPAVSAALNDLEARLGTTLFRRTPRGLEPTAAGETLVLHFKRVLAELRHVAPDLAAAEGTVSGSVHVGALPLGRTRILPAAIAALVARHPQVHVATVESPYEALAAALRSGEIDFILGALRDAAATRDLEQEGLFDDRIAVIARAGHPLARARRLDFDRLRQAAWVFSRQGSPSRELLERFFAAAHERPPVPRVETGDLAVLRGLLLESDMLTAISPHQLRYEIRDATLVVLDFPLERTRRRIGLTQRHGAFPSPGARALMDEIRHVVARSPEFR
jgi:LysR family transcriptional regulator of gallate degradation